MADASRKYLRKAVLLTLLSGVMCVIYEALTEVLLPYGYNHYVGGINRDWAVAATFVGGPAVIVAAALVHKTLWRVAIVVLGSVAVVGVCQIVLRSGSACC